jgi:hypothetical protein
MKAGAYDQAKQDALARTKRRKHDPGDKNWVYNVWTKPMPLLSELMIGGGCLGLPTSKTGRTSNTVVSNKRSKKWGIPKGRAETPYEFQ